MIVVSHVTGNTNVRELLSVLESAGRLHSYHTSLAFDKSDILVRIAPEAVRQELLRRSYPLPKSRIVAQQLRELMRLFFVQLSRDSSLSLPSGWQSVYPLYVDLDRRVARFISKPSNRSSKITGVYCYEDGALETFKAAREFGLTRYYDLPIPYWETTHRLMDEEAIRMPEWKATLGTAEDSKTKLERKTEEIVESDVVICNSSFTYNSLPEQIKKDKNCIIAEYGAPNITTPVLERKSAPKEPLRVLFAGAMTQRKGLGDLFAAMRLLKTKQIELIVMGAPLLPMKFYRRQFPDFIYEPPRPREDVLRLMQSCDLFAFPSIVEGRGLVQLEAMACGLPLISTTNATGDDLVDEGENGFLVPIRSPEKIAESIAWFADHRERIRYMGMKSRENASRFTWEKYATKILEATAIRLAEDFA